MVARLPDNSISETKYGIGQNIGVLKASVDDEKTGKEKVVAIAWLTAPAAYKASQRTWLHLFKIELLHPVVDGVFE